MATCLETPQEKRMVIRLPIRGTAMKAPSPENPGGTARDTLGAVGGRDGAALTGSGKRAVCYMV